MSQTCGAVLDDVRRDSMSIDHNQVNELHEKMKCETSNNSDVNVLVNEDIGEENNEIQRKNESFEEQPYQSVSWFS